jgi:hypothetical protein
MMAKFVQLLKKNSILNFISSVRLAVPLMLVLAVVVSVGTVYESIYNSEYASLMVYKSWWFTLLQCLLWVNIFLSTLSRWPYKMHHLGFVITHIGLMTLLIGGFVTGVSGIDGQLRIATGAASSTVVLSQPVVGYQFHDSPRAQSVELPRRLAKATWEKDSKANAELRHLFWIKQFLPFSTPEKVAAEKSDGGPVTSAALSFRLKSAFFDVSDWLDTNDNPVMQMGPATLMVKLGKYSGAKPIKKRKPQSEPVKAVKKSGITIKAIDRVTKRLLAEKNISSIPVNWKVAGIDIKVNGVFKHAIVSENKLAEGPPTSWNPAVELEVSVGGKNLREVLYQKFPDFSLLQDANLPFQLVLVGGDESAAMPETSSESKLPPNHPPIESSNEDASGGMNPGMGGTNQIEFWVDPLSADRAATVVLKKSGAVVSEQTLSEGETLQTPWMGIVLTLANVNKGGRMQMLPREIEPERGKPLPPSAILIQLADSQDSFWLVEGSSQTVQLMGRPADIFYGRKTVSLPFEIELKKFSKVDYPGTETPMSFESLVGIKGSSDEQVISMNEPLKRQGFTVYQSSFIDNPGETVESIFSVNQDPGRPIKYIGSLILAIGIILLTVMRSNWWRKLKEQKV